MAASYICGFEMGALGECDSSSGTVSVQSTTVRSGTYALRINPTAAAAWVRFRSRLAAGTFQNSFFSVRFYMRVATLPGAAQIIGLSTTSASAAAASSVRLRLNSTGTLEVSANNGTNTATSTKTLSADGLWHRIDLDAGYTAGAGARVFVDGEVWASSATGTPATLAGWQIGDTANATSDMYYDDIVFYDGTLTNTVDDYKINILLPTSDNAVGNWKRNDGSTTTSLWDSVNNLPPTGTTAVVLDTDRILNKTSAASSTYDGNCAAYNTVVTANGLITAICAICNDAQAVTTGSPKAGSVSIASNPAVTAATFDYGLPNGTTGSTTAAAMGTFPSGWGTHLSAVLERPAVTVSSGPVVRVNDTASTTREVDVDFLAVYVVWQNPVANGIIGKFQAINRAASF